MPTISQAFVGAVGFVFFSALTGCGIEPSGNDAIGVSDQALANRADDRHGNGHGKRNGHHHHGKGKGKGHHQHGNGHGYGHDCDDDTTCDTVDTSCDGIDNDCDGSIDEDFQPTGTTCGLGACASVGATSCVAGTVVDSCTPAPGAANDSVCDGIDNDCNGSVDEDFQPAGTTCGLGVCASVGATSCVAGTLINSCTPAPGAANDSVCNGLDDNCNGLVDEDYQPSCTGSTAVTACVAGVETEQACAGTICTPAECAGGCYDDDVNALRNASFESVPGTALGQGLMASEWTNRIFSADTYSNDNTYGLAPGGFNHFNGEVAQDGKRWVAGGSFPESFSQLLTTPFTPGAAYNVSAWLIQDNGSLNNPGSYRVRLWNGTPGLESSATAVGSFAPTVAGSESWVFRSFCFVAPADASALPHILLEPTQAGPNLAYPGIDNIQIVETCGCP